VGIGVGKVEEYFEKSAVEVSSIAKLPFAFQRIVENYLRRLFEV